MYPNQLNDLFCKSPFLTLARKIGIILTYSITLFRISVLCHGTSDTRVTKFHGLPPCMARRKPTLSWIKTVLVDTETRGESAGKAALPVVAMPMVPSGNRRAVDDRRALPDGDDVLPFLSWQVMRAAARPSGLSSTSGANRNLRGFTG
jgi:hypothetical protein